MKIMIVTPYFFPKIGGLENYALNIAKGLRDQGKHDVFIVTSNHTSRKYVEEKIEGLRVIRLPRLFKISNTPINPFWYFKLRKIIKEEKPDVINAHTPVPFMADMAARASKNIPFVLTYQNDLVKTSRIGRLLSKYLYLLLINKTLRISTMIITTSRYYADKSPHLMKWKEKVQIVSPGVNVDMFNIAVDKTWLKQKYPGKKIVLFVGSMQDTHKHKGVDVLIRAVAQAKLDIPNIQLVAVGSGDAIPIYTLLAEELGVADVINFTGFVTDKDLPKYYAGSDILVLPSTTDSEGFGMVLIEAMACGTPVIGTKAGGIPFVINDNKSGLLVEPKSVESLSHAINSLLDSSESSEESANEAAKKIAKDYDWQTKVDLTYKLFVEAIKPRVCLIHNIVSPYRLPMFEELNKSVNLTVLFCKPITKDRVWSYNLDSYSFKYKLMGGFTIGPVIYNTHILKTLLNTKFDMIIANNDPDVAPIAVSAILVAKLRGRGFINWSEVTSDDVYYFPSMTDTNSFYIKFIYKLLSSSIHIYRKFCFKMADYVVSFSNKAQDYASSNRVPRAKLIRSYEIMPLELLPEPTNIIRDKTIRFIYVGYLNRRKGIEYLIRAFKQIQDEPVELIIVGTGPQEESLRTIAADDSRIKFSDYMEGTDKANLYASADILVLPTLHDVWGLVINETIHYGLAVICTDTAGAIEIIDESTGLIVPPRDVTALRDAMLRLINNPGMLQDMKTHNLNRTDVSDVANSVNGFIESVNAIRASRK